MRSGLNLKGHLTSRFPEFVWRTWKRGAGTRRPGPVPRNLYTQHASSVVLFQVSRNSDAVRSGPKNMLSGLSSRSWWSSFRTSNEELSSSYIFRENFPPPPFFFIFPNFSKFWDIDKFVQFLKKKKEKKTSPIYSRIIFLIPKFSQFLVGRKKTLHVALLPLDPTSFQKCISLLKKFSPLRGLRVN